jgi:hypothetical protein
MLCIVCQRLVLVYLVFQNECVLESCLIVCQKTQFYHTQFIYFYTISRLGAIAFLDEGGKQCKLIRFTNFDEETINIFKVGVVFCFVVAH